MESIDFDVKMDDISINQKKIRIESEKLIQKLQIGQKEVV
ncbi:hypothetical protein Amet_2839 [Alkaliphilus metalliredigens QYMF]|uniref:Uncharacterized protein n=1 Tax=Alkaliphilus metalliredigens (strain QYMF) TaxID=293826 RepID=A6TS21_ALKMQ|nr:hypothetical protein Amet_2839 [Alkaliphilus metalliredigens QYMF]